MRAQILSKHKSEYPKPSASRPVITYLSRQKTGRRLTDQGHLDVIEELQAIAKTGKAEYRMEVFEDVPVPEQWARLARTTVCHLCRQSKDTGRLTSRQIFVAVHGNGLTHIIFMPGFPGSAVYEMQPEHCQIVRCSIHVRCPAADFIRTTMLLLHNSEIYRTGSCRMTSEFRQRTLPANCVTDNSADPTFSACAPRTNARLEDAITAITSMPTTLPSMPECLATVSGHNWVSSPGHRFR